MLHCILRLCMHCWILCVIGSKARSFTAVIKFVTLRQTEHKNTNQTIPNTHNQTQYIQHTQYTA